VLEGHSLDMIEIIKITQGMVEHHEDEGTASQKIQLRDPSVCLYLLYLHLATSSNLKPIR
jgi:hypothetical protein